MMSLTFGLFTQVSGSGPLGPLVYSERPNLNRVLAVLSTKGLKIMKLSMFKDTVIILYIGTLYVLGHLFFWKK